MPYIKAHTLAMDQEQSALIDESVATEQDLESEYSTATEDFENSDMEGSVLNRPRPKKAVRMQIKPVKGEVRTSLILDKLSRQLKELGQIQETKRELDSDPHDSYISSEESPSEAAGDSDDESIIEFDDPYNGTHSRCSSPQSETTQAKVMSVVKAGRPHIVKIERPRTASPRTSAERKESLGLFHQRSFEGRPVSDIITAIPTVRPSTAPRSGSVADITEGTKIPDLPLRSSSRPTALRNPSSTLSTTSTHAFLATDPFPSRTPTPEKHPSPRLPPSSSTTHAATVDTHERPEGKGLNHKKGFRGLSRTFKLGSLKRLSRHVSSPHNLEPKTPSAAPLTAPLKSATPELPIAEERPKPTTTASHEPPTTTTTTSSEPPKPQPLTRSNTEPLLLEPPPDTKLTVAAPDTPITPAPRAISPAPTEPMSYQNIMKNIVHGPPQRPASTVPPTPRILRARTSMGFLGGGRRMSIKG